MPLLLAEWDFITKKTMKFILIKPYLLVEKPQFYVKNLNKNYNINISN